MTESEFFTRPTGPAGLKPRHGGQGWFLRTVGIRFPSGTTISVSSAGQALLLLKQQWPVRMGPSYRKAVEICESQVSVKTATSAEHAFRAAAVEAGLCWPDGNRAPR